MISRTVARAAAQRASSTTTTSLVARRGFQTTRAQLSSPYHYAEGPYTNLPFNTKTRFFAFRYWSFCAAGFGLPFLISVWQTKKPKA
ncbi:putative cytochrome-c oxidase chain viic protein [Phialemonium atrogriseum]|uniref:Cytochrome c oxidase subunit 8, mitochondrial n=1 Tax=Phialemonium atrogriseum TaxID=1093897 RepID=A0AAJ0FRJ0_9PEZI|nr:putative cytochrome-c oxidase chain viic protein [Phialemonium atrogriseum]KAK1772333.1 putative cytochrome-c oxidase chain viic protein [Phialemonium atrogriseum]